LDLGIESLTDGISDPVSKNSSKSAPDGYKEGKFGEQDERALRFSIAAIAWNKMPDLSSS
jgi:hypothetical protein